MEKSRKVWLGILSLITFVVLALIFGAWPVLTVWVLSSAFSYLREKETDRQAEKRISELEKRNQMQARMLSRYNHQMYVCGSTSDMKRAYDELRGGTPPEQ
jgi:hypothetical protein